MTTSSTSSTSSAPSLSPCTRFPNDNYAIDLPIIVPRNLITNASLRRASRSKSLKKEDTNDARKTRRDHDRSASQVTVKDDSITYSITRTQALKRLFSFKSSSARRPIAVPAISSTTSTITTTTLGRSTISGLSQSSRRTHPGHPMARDVYLDPIRERFFFGKRVVRAVPGNERALFILETPDAPVTYLPMAVAEAILQHDVPQHHIQTVAMDEAQRRDVELNRPKPHQPPCFNRRSSSAHQIDEHYRGFTDGALFLMSPTSEEIARIEPRRQPRGTLVSRVDRDLRVFARGAVRVSDSLVQDSAMNSFPMATWGDSLVSKKDQSMWARLLTTEDPHSVLAIHELKERLPTLQRQVKYLNEAQLLQLWRRVVMTDASCWLTSETIELRNFASAVQAVLPSAVALRCMLKGIDPVEGSSVACHVHSMCQDVRDQGTPLDTLKKKSSVVPDESALLDKLEDLLSSFLNSDPSPALPEDHSPASNLSTIITLPHCQERDAPIEHLRGMDIARPRNRVPKSAIRNTPWDWRRLRALGSTILLIQGILALKDEGAKFNGVVPEDDWDWWTLDSSSCESDIESDAEYYIDLLHSTPKSNNQDTLINRTIPPDLPLGQRRDEISSISKPSEDPIDTHSSSIVISSTSDANTPTLMEDSRHPQPYSPVPTPTEERITFDDSSLSSSDRSIYVEPFAAPSIGLKNNALNRIIQTTKIEEGTYHHSDAEEDNDHMTNGDNGNHISIRIDPSLPNSNSDPTSRTRDERQIEHSEIETIDMELESPTNSLDGTDANINASKTHNHRHPNEEQRIRTNKLPTPPKLLYNASDCRLLIRSRGANGDGNDTNIPSDDQLVSLKAHPVYYLPSSRFSPVQVAPMDETKRVTPDGKDLVPADHRTHYCTYGPPLSSATTRLSTSQTGHKEVDPSLFRWHVISRNDRMRARRFGF